MHYAQNHTRRSVSCTECVYGMDDPSDEYINFAPAKAGKALPQQPTAHCACVLNTARTIAANSYIRCEARRPMTLDTRPCHTRAAWCNGCERSFAKREKNHCIRLPRSSATPRRNQSFNCRGSIRSRWGERAKLPISMMVCCVLLRDIYKLAGCTTSYATCITVNFCQALANLQAR